MMQFIKKHQDLPPTEAFRKRNDIAETDALIEAILNACVSLNYTKLENLIFDTGIFEQKESSDFFITCKRIFLYFRTKYSNNSYINFEERTCKFCNHTGFPVFYFSVYSNEPIIKDRKLLGTFGFNIEKMDEILLALCICNEACRPVLDIL